MVEKEGVYPFLLHERKLGEASIWETSVCQRPCVREKPGNMTKGDLETLIATYRGET